MFGQWVIIWYGISLADCRCCGFGPNLFYIRGLYSHFSKTLDICVKGWWKLACFIMLWLMTFNNGRWEVTWIYCTSFLSYLEDATFTMFLVFVVGALVNRKSAIFGPWRSCVLWFPYFYSYMYEIFLSSLIKLKLCLS